MKKYVVLIAAVVVLAFIAEATLAAKGGSKGAGKGQGGSDRSSRIEQTQKLRQPRGAERPERDREASRRGRDRIGRGTLHQQQLKQLDTQIEKSRITHQEAVGELGAIKKLIEAGKTKAAAGRIDKLIEKRSEKFAETVKKLEQKRERIREQIQKQAQRRSMQKTTERSTLGDDQDQQQKKDKKVESKKEESKSSEEKGEQDKGDDKKSGKDKKPWWKF